MPISFGPRVRRRQFVNNRLQDLENSTRGQGRGKSTSPRKVWSATKDKNPGSEGLCKEALIKLQQGREQAGGNLLRAGYVA